MESTIGIEIKRIQIKFVEDLQGGIVFLGIKDELVYTMKGPSLEISSVKVIIKIIIIVHSQIKKWMMILRDLIQIK